MPGDLTELGRDGASHGSEKSPRSGVIGAVQQDFHNSRQR